MSTQIKFLLGVVAALAVAILAYVDPALAQEAAAEAAPAAEPAKPVIDTGDTAWMLTSTALVLMMTIPGLALFYGGMVRKKNVLTVVMQCFAITCIVTVLWMVVGYSLGLHRRRRHAEISRRHVAVHAQGHDARQHQCAGRHDPRIGVHDLPDDLRHHHAGPHRRRLRRPHEVLGLGAVHDPLAASRLCADRALGVGRRLPRRRWRARFRRWHRGAYQCRYRGPRLRAVSRQALWLRHREHGAA